MSFTVAAIRLALRHLLQEFIQMHRRPTHGIFRCGAIVVAFGFVRALVTRVGTAETMRETIMEDTWIFVFFFASTVVVAFVTLRL